MISIPEKKLEKPKSTTVKQLSLSEVDRHSQEHIISRSAIYPGSFVERFPVPNDKVSWDVSKYRNCNQLYRAILQMCCVFGDGRLVVTENSFVIIHYFQVTDDSRKVAFKTE